MILEGFGVGPMGANCYIIGCDKTKEAVVVDPGAEGGRILSRLKSLGLTCKYIILTHGHVDHIAALKEVREATGAQVLIHTRDADMLTNPGLNLSMFMGTVLKFKEAERLLEDGDKIQVGQLSIEVIHTPGHTPGGISLKVGKNLITGDTLFQGSVGRSDFPGGNHNVLINSIKNRLMVFPDETKVYPGHGPVSTIGAEKRYNPFL
ncbi:MBL fold metallo-hydrolase [Desulfallas thermosapovorans]|uniref:Glyoxylase-like metal-dependent hydrolase (Beta-lactamase superfamily II) n=1 Tax=Desulfallas thermosapovorans DSM 6562 TaxID=1121431 RepID=A0A5S4ZQW8_9FIRM|nr:MBL fold metallo-hydrolase [Desulfallas thermosapovorans]TYO95100.1 glyoxylase-like metal-dependent hydrolase (beta-lactamase superfamily II) [Desulfallas thermosapovorans DSM 6562]